MKKRRPSHCLKLSLSLIFCILLGCSKPTDSVLLTIDISKQSDPPVPLSEIAKSVKLVQLETSDGSLLNRIQDVKLVDHRLYVVDMAGKILVFDTQGEFLFMLGSQGDGPGEYSYISSMAIDKAAGLVYVASGRKLLSFSLDNELIAEEYLPEFIDFLDVYEGKLYAIVRRDGIQTDDGYVNQTTLLEFNASFDVADSITVKRVVLKNMTAASFPYKHFISNLRNGRYLYTPVLTNEQFLRDTLYQLEDKVLIPFAKFNFEKPHLNERGDKMISIKNMVKSESYLFCEYDAAGENRLYLYGQENSTGYNLKEGLLDGDGDAVMLRPLDLENDVFYYVQTAEYSDNATEELNPVIGIAALK